MTYLEPDYTQIFSFEKRPRGTVNRKSGRTAKSVVVSSRFGQRDSNKIGKWAHRWQYRHMYFDLIDPF